MSSSSSTDISRIVSFLSISPIWGNEFPYEGFELVSQVQIFRITLFFSVMFCIYIFLNSWFRQWQERKFFTNFKTLPIFLLPIFLASAMVIQQPYLVARGKNSESACEKSETNIDICVLANYKYLLPLIKEETDILFKKLDIQDPSKIIIAQNELQINTGDKIVYEVYSPPALDIELTKSRIYGYLISEVSGIGFCPADKLNSGLPDIETSWSYRAKLNNETWWENQIFSNYSDKEMADFYNRNTKELHECKAIAE
jgi:uncharacterized membrane protein (DUF485 family)